MIDEPDEPTMEQCTDLLRMVMHYAEANKFNAGFTLVIATRSTVRTAGNMDADTQRAAFKMLVDKLQTEPEDVVEIDNSSGKVIGNATH